MDLGEIYHDDLHSIQLIQRGLFGGILWKLQ
jgi:hypothetical protein